jgi:hypothetical protein
MAARQGRRGRLDEAPIESERIVARGFESKGVEAQQEAAVLPKQSGPRVSREEAARRGERASLLLARTRALADLQQASAPAHRAMLEQAIADLDRRVAALSDPL